MRKVTWQRLTAAVVITAGAYIVMGASGLWGVALAAPALCLAPSAIRDAVAERRDKRALNMAVAEILAGSRDRG